MDELEQLKARLDRRERQLAAVYRIGQALYSKVDFEELLWESLSVALRTVHASAGSILLYDPGKDRLIFKYAIGEKAPLLKDREEIRPDEGIAGEVFRSGQPLITPDVAQDPHHAAHIDEATHFQTRNMITVPLKNQDQPPIGVLEALNKALPDGQGEADFDKDDLEMLNLVATLVTSLIENASLHEDAKLAIVAHRVSHISHDIANMMTPVVFAAQELQSELKSLFHEMARVRSDVSLSSAQKLARIAEMASSLEGIYPQMIDIIQRRAEIITDWTRAIADCVKNHDVEPHFEPQNINEIIGWVLQPLQLEARRFDVGITARYEDLPPIFVDRRLLYSVVHNLVSNAISETPGGRITVATHDVPGGTFPEGDCILIEVSDTGRGIPPDILKTLFTHHVRTTKSRHTGLGTQIVKRAVDAHTGCITVESEVGKGTTFHIRLPRRIAPAFGPVAP